MTLKQHNKILLELVSAIREEATLQCGCLGVNELDCGRCYQGRIDSIQYLIKDYDKDMQEDTK